MTGGPCRRMLAGFDESSGNPSVMEWHRYCREEHDFVIDEQNFLPLKHENVTCPSLLLETITVRFCDDPTAWKCAL